MKLRFTITIAALFAVGAMLILFGPYKDHLASRNVAVVDPAVIAAKQTPKTNASIEGRPVRIQIPSLKINIPIVNGYYDAKKQDWTLNNDSAQYATITPLANNAEGNTFIYGHNQPPVFGRLPKILPGQKAYLFTDNGHKFTYTFTSARETVPSDDSLFRYKGAPILTLQTCSGFFSQNRELFTFNLTEAV